MRRTSLAIATALVAASLFVPLGAGAAPSPYAYRDTTGEVPAKADITRFRVAYGDVVTLDVRLRKGTDPRSGAPWEDRLTGVLWLIDVSGGATPEYAAFFYNGGPGTLDGEVDYFDFPDFDEKACETDESFHDGNRYRLEFPPACIGNPSYLRVQAIMVLDKAPANLTRGLPSDEDVIDYAPNRAFSLTPKIKKEG
jgi:hypothetical protein